MWVGLVQSVESLKRKNIKKKGVCLQNTFRLKTITSTLVGMSSPSLVLPHSHESCFCKINLSHYIYILLFLFLWRMLTNTLFHSLIMWHKYIELWHSAWQIVRAQYYLLLFIRRFLFITNLRNYRYQL